MSEHSHRDFRPLTPGLLERFRSLVAADRFSTGESVLDLHARDQSKHPPCRPEAVIFPVEKSEVSRILALANENLVPVTGWGAGSSLEGNPIPVRQGLVLDFSRMNRILDIRPDEFQVDVEPGVIYKELNGKLRHLGLFFPPDPGAGASIGGMIANNASGVKAIKYGATKDHVLKLNVILADGSEIETGTRATKSSSGYDLLHLFVGSEGTLGLVVEATIRLTGVAEELSAAVANFSSVQDAARAVYGMIRSGLGPAALELLDPNCVTLLNREKNLGLEDKPTLFMEFHGPVRSYMAELLEMAETLCRENGCLDFRPGLGRAEVERIMKARHELGEVIMRNHPDCDVLALDVAVPIAAYPEMLRAIREEFTGYGRPVYVFSHAGDGNLHPVIPGKKGDPAEWGRLNRAADNIIKKTLELGGTCTGEHGVGIGKRKFMPLEHGEGLAWMKKIKDLFDPRGILNPGKIFPDRE